MTYQVSKGNEMNDVSSQVIAGEKEQGYTAMGGSPGSPPLNLSSIAIQPQPHNSISSKHQKPYILNGRPMYLSKREKLLVDTYLSTHNISECVRVYEKELGMTVDRRTVEKWLKRTHVKAFIGERLADEGYFNLYEGEAGKKRWLREALEYRDSMKPMNKWTAYMHDLVAHYMGYEVPKGNIFSADKMQINFVQGNGEA